MTSDSNLNIWRSLADKDIRRSLAVRETRPIKLTFSTDGYQQVADISRALRWAEGQVVLEAIQAYCQLAGASSLLDVSQVPDIILLTRARRAYSRAIEPETALSICSLLNVGLRLCPEKNLNKPQGEGATQWSPTLDPSMGGLV